MAGNIVSKVQPVYPPDAKAQGVEGSVVLRALIGKDGRVEKLAVMSGSPLLSGAAIDAVKQWVYRPYLLNGEPVEVDTTITVNCSFEGGSAQPGVDYAATVDAAVMTDNTIKRVPPVYPPIAKLSHVQGDVVLHVIIGVNGTVESMKVVSGHPMLQQAAMDAVKQWVYRPYIVNGVRRRVDTTVTVNFYLTNS